MTRSKPRAVEPVSCTQLPQWSFACEALKSKINDTHRIAQLHADHEREVDNVLAGSLLILDTVEKAEEAFKTLDVSDNPTAQRVMRRFANVRKRVMQFLEKNAVEPVTLPDGMLVEKLCSVTDTEPDPTRPDGAIVNVERQGYIRHGRLLRPAEVVIVKN